jgi:GT2 family glycosyltransferase
VELHRPKQIDMGFAIIAPEPNLGNLLCTVRSIKNNYPVSPYVCAVIKNMHTEEYKKMSEICTMCKGKNTITSLINTALKKSKSEWTLVVMQGVPVHRGLDKKYGLFIENKKDVLFSITMEYDRSGKIVKVRNNFEDATLNGMLIHRDTFKEVGLFPDGDLSIPAAKLFWAAQAVDKGCKFKGILGTRIL